MENKMHMSELHSEFISWIKSMLFYKDEFSFLQKRLEEIAVKNNSHEVMRYVEHFQNQFILQKEVIDILKHDLNEEDTRLAEYAKANPVASDHQLFGNHDELKDRFETFEKLYLELKTDFEKFLAQNL